MFLVQNKPYLEKMLSLNFAQYWQREQTKKAVQEKHCQKIKKKYTVHSLSPQSYSEFIILSRMDIQNHMILQ